MNYKIIQDKQKLLDFIEWLPDLQENETFYYCLFARNKYVRGTEHEKFLKADKCQLKRGTSKKDFLFDKIKQLEVELGSYKQNGYVIPQESLALYINPNPRNEYDALLLLMERGAKLVRHQSKGFGLKSEILSAIQVSNSKENWELGDFAFDIIELSKRKAKYVDFDFDDSNFEDYKEAIENQIGEEYTVLKTRGGFHLLVEPSKVVSTTNWYKTIIGWEAVDTHGDQLLPVPGCCQGGFIPYFL